MKILVYALYLDEPAVYMKFRSSAFCNTELFDAAYFTSAVKVF